jgi:hypothetical protein
MGFGIRVMPGVRVSASSRGVRAGIGPRAARVHVGSGRTGISTGFGPVTAYTSLGGSRRRSSGARAPSMAGYERQVRAGERQAEFEYWLNLNRSMVALGQAHREEFPPAQRPVAPAPESIDAKVIRHRHETEQREGIAFFKRAERKAAKQRAAELAAREASLEKTRREQEQLAEQARLDDAWRALLDNEPGQVFASIEAAFEDNEMPAACIDVDGDSATVLMRIAQPSELVPERMVALTPTGKPTHHKRTKTDINQIYADLLASHVLATVSEALAVAPGLSEVRAIVIRGDQVGGSTHSRLPLRRAVSAGRPRADRPQGREPQPADRHRERRRSDPLQGQDPRAHASRPTRGARTPCRCREHR